MIGGLQPPMFGEFKDGRGIFYNQETFEGKKIFVRFIWSSQDENRCQYKEGKDWTTRKRIQ